MFAVTLVAATKNIYQSYTKNEFPEKTYTSDQLEIIYFAKSTENNVFCDFNYRQVSNIRHTLVGN